MALNTPTAMVLGAVLFVGVRWILWAVANSIKSRPYDG